MSQCRSGSFYNHVGCSESCSPCSTWVTLLGGGPPGGSGHGPSHPVCTALPWLCSPAHEGQVFAPLCSPPPGGSLPSGVLPVVETLFSLLLSVFADFSACLSLIHAPPCLLAPHFLQTLSTALCHNLPLTRGLWSPARLTTLPPPSWVLLPPASALLCFPGVSKGITLPITAEEKMPGQAGRLRVGKAVLRPQVLRASPLCFLGAAPGCSGTCFLGNP